MPHRSFFWQLLFSYLWIIVLALAIIVVFATRTVEHLYVAELTTTLRHQAELFSGLVAERTTRPEAVDRTCKRMGGRTRTRFTVILHDGTVIGDSNEEPARMDNHATPDRKEVTAALSGRIGVIQRFSNTLKRRMLYVAVPLPSPTGNLVIRAALPLARIELSLARVRNQVLLVGLGASLGLVLVSMQLTRRLSRPLRELERGARELAQGRMQYRFADAGPREIRAVVRAMNHMAEQLQERWEELRRQREQERAILASLSEGVLAVDPGGSIIFINRAGRELLGLPAVGSRTQCLAHAVIRYGEFLACLDRALHAAAAFRERIRLRAPRGGDAGATPPAGAGERVFDLRCTPLTGEDGTRLGTLVVFGEVTRMEHLERMRKDFVANVSHELRTPITTIKGFLETLLDGAMNEPENRERFLRILLKQADRLDAIITDLLLLCRVEEQEARRGVQREPHDLAGVIAAATEVCAGDAIKRGVNIIQACPPGLACACNANLLVQAIVNLLANAIRHSEAGQEVRVDARTRADAIIIAVTDHGCGIPPAHQARIFERFYRVDKARSREQGGTGLGLAIVKHIAGLHNGKVEFRSEVGKGSTFSILLPRA